MSAVASPAATGILDPRTGKPIGSDDAFYNGLNAELADKGFLITRIDLVTDAVVPGVDDATFQEHAGNAKTGCIISRALAANEITLKATLHG